MKNFQFELGLKFLRFKVEIKICHQKLGLKCFGLNY